MALATRPTPTTHHRKRQAGHHRRSKGYLRTYWPYIPMLAIVGTGVVVNNAIYGSGFGVGSTISAAGPVASTRIEVMTNQAPWSLLIVISITAMAAVIFAFSHWYRVHKVISRGEKFVVRHPWFDTALVLVLTGGLLLTRTVA